MSKKKEERQLQIRQILEEKEKITIKLHEKKDEVRKSEKRSIC